jgi:glycosyltransferase involved in cell wall biosynthesis
MRSISICSLNDPTSPRSWSGTPYAICQELQRRGRLGSTLQSSPKNKFINALTTITSCLYYFGSIDNPRGRICRFLNAHKVYKKFATGTKDAILHLGTLDLPVLKGDTNDHYLFCDATWHTWSERSDLRLYSAKMLMDAEQMEKEAYAQMKHIFSISNYVKEDLITHYGVSPEKISVVGTGQGKIVPYTGEKDYTNSTIIFVAKERYEDKGGPLLVAGFKLARQRRPDLQLIIIGDEKYRSIIGEEQNIRVTGYIPWDELQHLFDTASLFAMPARNEPWGLVYIEALLCKTPVFGLNRNALPEITQNGKYGFLIETETPEAVAEALLEACSSPAHLAEMGRSGQQYCLETYSWEKTVTRILDQIDSSTTPIIDLKFHQ